MAAPTRVSATPSAFNTSTSPQTVAGVAVQAGDLITVRGIGEDGQVVWTTPTSAGLAFTPLGDVGTNGASSRVTVWSADIASPGTISVAMSDTGATGWWGFLVTVWRDHAGIGQVATVNGGTSPNSASLAITTTAANSALEFAFGDWNAIDGTSRTYRSVNGSAATEDSYFRDSAHFAAYAAYYADAGAIGSYTVGTTAPTGQKYTVVAVEVKGGATVAASPIIRTFNPIPFM